ncbi:MAG: hypothetical protein OEU92_08045 [Alphaproteobacteria bacterium]|nr:hypothetical protein [Alphaproteobacteria bacterium]
MSVMSLDPSDHPRPGELLQTVIAADALEKAKPLDEGLYLERDTLLDDELFETSLDDYDDLLSVAADDDYDFG